MKIIFLAIIAALVALSFVLSRKIKDGRDFLVPSGGIPFIVVAFTMAATQFGSSMLVGGVQQAQQQPIGQGFYPAIYTLLAASASCFINILIAPRYRKFGDSVTPPDFIEHRYGKSKFMRAYHSIAYICSITCVLVSQFIGFTSLGVAIGFSYNFSLALCAVVVCLLALGSGLLGVAFTDMIQFAAIVVLLAVSSVFSLQKLGSVGVSFAQVAGEAFFPAEGMKDKFFYTLWPMLIGNLFSYEYFMRFMSCRGEKEARKASASAGILLLVVAIPVALLGSVANYCYQGEDSASVFGLIISSDMPKWFSFLMIVTILMAVLTSADSMLTSISGMVSRDIYGGLLHSNKDYSKLKYSKLISKITIVVVSIVAMVLALFFKQILQISFFFSPLTSGTMFAPMIIGLFWKKANRKGAVAAVVCASISGILHSVGAITLFDRVAGPALIGTIVLIAVSLLTQEKVGKGTVSDGL